MRENRMHKEAEQQVGAEKVGLFLPGEMFSPKGHPRLAYYPGVGSRELHLGHRMRFHHQNNNTAEP